MNMPENEFSTINRETDAIDALNSKMKDLNTPGHLSEFDPEEAEILGAFSQEALSLEEALAGSVDLIRC